MTPISRRTLLIGAGAALCVTGLPLSVAHSQTVRLSLVTGSVAGTWYPVGAGISRAVEREFPEISITVETGGGASNARTIGTNPNVIGMTAPDIAYFAVRGEREFEGEGGFPLRGLLSGHLSPNQLVVDAGSPIQTIEDIRGERVAVGYPGSTVETMTRAMVTSLGMTYDDFDAQWLDAGEVVAALRDRRIAAGFIAAGAPTSAITEFATTREMRLIPITSEQQERIIQDHPYYEAGEIPAGTYRGQDEPVPAIFVGTYLVAHEELGEDVTYRITKAILENPDVLLEAHVLGAEWNVERASADFAIPRHAGAEKYLREIGRI